MQDPELLREGDQGYGLLLRLSRPGAGSGEHLGKRRGVNLDAAVLAEQRRKSLEERRLNPEAPAPAPTVTGDATLYALGEHLRIIFDRVDINGAISASRRVETPSRHRCDSCPSDEVVGGLFFDFEVVRTESTARRLAADRGCPASCNACVWCVPVCDRIETRSKSKKKPPTTSSDGHESY